MIKRHLETILKGLAKKYPIITLTGPRQSGKTTLAKTAFSDYSYVSMEDPDARAFAEKDPRGFLSKYSEYAIFDEVQRTPDLFSYIQTLVDEKPTSGRFILTGSQQFLLSEKISQSLAGRTAILKLLPFSLAELMTRKPNNYWETQDIEPVQAPDDDLFRFIYKGFYPRLYDKKLEPSRWYMEYFETYVSRDLRNITHIGDLRTFETFLRLLAGRSGQLLNLSSLGNDSGVSHTTIKRWISILEASYIIHILPPYYKNFGKRHIKSPKIYFLDTGLLCSLLRIQRPDDIVNHPLRGSIFETFVFAELLKHFTNYGKEAPLYFWQGSQGKEIDILIDHGTSLLPLEIKSGQTISEDFFNNIKEWMKMACPVGCHATLVYGGAEYQKRSSTNIIPWFGIS